jgi:hypothetical protein
MTYQTTPSLIITHGLGGAPCTALITAPFSLIVRIVVDVEDREDLVGGGLWLPPGEVKNLFQKVRTGMPMPRIKAKIKSKRKKKDIEITLIFDEEEITKLYKYEALAKEVGVELIAKPDAAIASAQINQPNIKTNKQAITIDIDQPEVSVKIDDIDK